MGIAVLSDELYDVAVHVCAVLGVLLVYVPDVVSSAYAVGKMWERCVCCSGLPIQLDLLPHLRLLCSRCAATGGLAPADMDQPVASGQHKLLTSC